MPRGPTSDIQHVVFTDHSIRRKPVSSGTTPASTSQLMPYTGYTSTTRDLALAYAVVGLRDNNQTDLARAFPMLKQSEAEGNADSVASAYLAEFYYDLNDNTHAVPLYQQLWLTDPSQYAAASALGGWQMQSGNLPEAIQLWRQALALNPSMTLVRLNLAKVLLRTGNRDEAKRTLEKALQFNPASPEARDLLGQIK
jgi:tetratricopeptide (TPR) repeat protein